MKKLLLSVSLLSLLLIINTGQKASAQDVTVSFQTFYDELSPYGQWVYDAEYGNVWVPNEDGDFRPYGSRGNWVMTDYGNTWASQDPYGWAVYHYGRWTYDPYYGWIWVPGYEWAPAWVSWRYGGGYSGWAPLGPGVSISLGYNCPVSWWIFVAPRYMYQRNCYTYWRGPSYNNTYINQTTVINNYYVDNGTRVRYNYGPRRDVIERDTRQPVQVYRVSQTNRRGAHSISGNRVNIYRPQVNRGSVSQSRPANVIQAPRSIGRPQAATSIERDRRPEFRQQVQRQQPSNNNRQPGTNNQQRDNRQEQRNEQPAVNRQEQRRNEQPPVNRQEQRRNEQPPVNRQEQRRNEQPPVNRQEQQRQQPAPQRQQPAPQPQRQQPAPQPQRQQPAPQPQRQQPAPQPQRQQPAPQPQRQQPAPQPQRQQYQAPPQQRQQPAPQPQRQQGPPPQRQAPAQRNDQPRGNDRREGGRR